MLSSALLFCFLTNQHVFNIYKVLSTNEEEKSLIKINHKGFKDGSPAFGWGCDLICRTVTVMPASRASCGAGAMISTACTLLSSGPTALRDGYYCHSPHTDEGTEAQR